MVIFRFLLTSLAGLLSCGTLLAAPPPSTAMRESTEGSELNIENDRTSNRTRLRIENEYIDYESGDALNTLKYSASYAVGLRGRRDSQLTIDWPLVHYHAGNASTAGSATGMGDVEIALNHVLPDSGKFRWNLGVKAQLNTAQKSQLGDGMYVLKPNVGVSWRVSPRVKLSASLQYNQSLSRDSGVDERQTLDFKPGVEIKFPGSWYGYVEYAPKWDFKKAGTVRFSQNFSVSSLKFELGTALGRGERLVLASSYELPLSGGSRNGTYLLGLTYRFE